MTSRTHSGTLRAADELQQRPPTYAVAMVLSGTRPPPSHVIAHLSDPHLLAGGGLLAGHIDTVAQLRKALDDGA